MKESLAFLKKYKATYYHKISSIEQKRLDKLIAAVAAKTK